MPPKQAKALALLASGSSNTEVANAVGVSLRTIELWKSQPEFKTHLASLGSKLLDLAFIQLSAHIDEVNSELLRIILSPDTNDRVKVSAIQTYYNILNNAIETKAERTKDEKLQKLPSRRDDNNGQRRSA